MPAPATELPNRDSVTTIRPDGSRPFLFPAQPRGRFDRARRISAYALIAFYLAMPWIPVGGHPAVFLDVAGRRFHLFGIALATQDMWLLFFLITGLGYSLFFITALFGRVWCGWACPHTVFLDHVYRQIERWTDGDALTRKALHAAPWSAAKITKRIVKHTLYLLVSAIITHLMLAYFVSLPEVWAMVRGAPSEHWGAFGFIVITTGLIHFNFAWFREQTCIVLCPYGRIQSALIDDHSLIIGYDGARGEPRGKVGTAGAGDCVDCTRCVQVCPTGIDIRQGLQMECVGCTACIDACDEVMTRLRRPRGLIRYDSQNGFAGRPTRWIRPRTILYTVLLVAGAGAAGWALTVVKPADLSVTRMTGAPYILDGTTVRNQFLVRVVNKRSQPVTLAVSLAGVPADARQSGVGVELVIPALGEVVQPLILQQPRETYAGPFHFDVQIEDPANRVQVRRTAEFLGPDARLVRGGGKEQRE